VCVCVCVCLFQPAGDPVTRVKLYESIDHVLAVGSSSGAVSVFQLPNGMPGKSRQVNCVLCTMTIDNDIMINSLQLFLF